MPRSRHGCATIAVEVNRQTAAALGINQSAAITCVKPSGNSSQLLDCSSGLHARWAPYYIRNVRVATPLAALQGAARRRRADGPRERPDAGERQHLGRSTSRSRRPKAPITRNDRSAIEQCEFWLQNKLHWTEHNPSVHDHLPPGRGDRPDEVGLGAPRSDRRHGVPAGLRRQVRPACPYIEIDAARSTSSARRRSPRSTSRRSTATRRKT